MLVFFKLLLTICSKPASYRLNKKMSGRSLMCQLPALPRLSGLSPEMHPPIFLAPLLASIPQPSHQRHSFSTTSSLSVRANKKRDGNPHRGESALRRTGLRYPTGMSKQPLPQPVLDPTKRTKVLVDPNHGLWGFFNIDRKALTQQSEDQKIGMLWSSSAS